VTVTELIAELQEFPPDTEVFVLDDERARTPDVSPEYSGLTAIVTL
jgi:hypothetical protein